jgi:microcystin-dependent protein
MKREDTGHGSDLRGRTLIGAGQGPNLTMHTLGQQGGEEYHVLTIAEMPARKHYGFGEAYSDWPLGLRGPKGQMGSHGGKDYDNYYYGTTDEGGSAPFNNMQPYYGGELHHQVFIACGSPAPAVVNGRAAKDCRRGREQ